jgi:hypothetical protein
MQQYYHPSGLRACELCPRFVKKETKESEASERGRRIHLAIERGKFDDLEDDDRTVAAGCLEYFKSLQHPTEVYRDEVELISGNLRGRIDRIEELTATKVRILDWKTGRVPVLPADKNLQIQAYVKLLMDTEPRIECVETHIVAPLCTSSRATYYRETDEADHSLSDINLRIMAVIARINDETCEATPSEEACEWCGNKAHCPKLTAIAIRQGTCLPEPFRVEPTELLDPAARERRHILADLLLDWADQVKYADKKAVVEDGVVIPGYVLRSRKGKSEVLDIPAAFEILRAAGLVDNSILTACSLSLSKLADIYHAEKGGTEKEARETVETKLNALIARGEPVIWLQRGKNTKEGR